MANYDLTYEGSRVQGILDTGDELRDAGYIFRGEATPSTVPGTPTERVAYIGGPGTYTNFGSSTVVPSGSIGVFKYTGSAWSNQVIACTVPISTSVQNNDTTVPTGKAVKTAVDAEATARGNAISSEASARQLGDSTLQGGINTVSAAVTAINNAIGNGSVYAGIATPSSTPASGKVFYLAFTAGTYTNFNSLEVPQGINILKNNGSTWLLDSFLGIDDAPIQGSDNLVKSGGVLNSIIQNGPAFDLSAYNAQGGTLATYADLSAALTAINALPADFKKGGMSIKFVQSSDNKYVQYRLMSDEFTTDITQWAIADEGVYIENPEFVYVKTDAQGRILWAIKTDGTINYGAGVPPQVIDYINARIAGLPLDNILSFLDGLEEEDKTLRELLNERGEYIDNPEWIDVKTDSEGKILEGTKTDGTKVIGGDVTILGNIDIQGATYTMVQNSEWIHAIVDAEDKVICGIKVNGKFYADIVDERLELFNSIFSVVDNPEYTAVETDAESKVLGGRKTDGTKFENVGFETPKLNTGGIINETIKDHEGRSEVKTDSEDKILSYRDSEGVLHENVGVYSPLVRTNSLQLSSEGMTEFQNALKAAGFRPGGRGDWSDYDSQDGEYPLVLPMPKCAIINIISDYDLTQLSKEGYSNNPPYWPAGVEGVTYDIPTEIEFYDGQGNFFKKWTKMSAQGNSSMGLEKKNIALDFFDDDTFEGAFTTRFGEWVEQDSYHLKAFATDAFRCVSPVTYQLYDEMIKTRGIYNDYFWKRALIDFSTITETYNGSANLSDAELKMESGAKCFPKGFPCLVFQNGNFWGIYSFQLKKQRKNYHMEKDSATNIQLDGVIAGETLLMANGDSSRISWIPGNDLGFEVRNPKADYFVTAAGEKYVDYATTSQELAGLSTIDEVVPDYDPEREYAALEKCVVNNKMFMSRVGGNSGNNPLDASYGNKVKDVWKKATQYWIEITFTNEVKNSILLLSTYLTKLIAADDIYEQSQKTPEDVQAFKDVFEGFVDPANFIDYLIIADVVGGISQGKNWQWCTYDGVKWYLGLYDCDNALGQYWEVTEIRRDPNTEHTIRTLFHRFILKYYNDELEAQYKSLRDKGIISIVHIVELVKEWQGKIGMKYYVNEYKKWPNTTRFDSLYRLEKWISAEIENMDSVYHYN